MGEYAEYARHEEESAAFNELVMPHTPAWYEYLYVWRYPVWLLIWILQVVVRWHDRKVNNE